MCFSKISDEIFAPFTNCQYDYVNRSNNTKRIIFTSYLMYVHQAHNFIKRNFRVIFCKILKRKNDKNRYSFWGAESDPENEPENEPGNEPEMRQQKKNFFFQKIELYKVFKQN